MSLPKFGPGDKIFAKVRGYPPWPARVEGVADETPNKMKYHVYFYGTGETAVCKQEELFNYVENREKYGKPMKKKGFNEALFQIDSELGITPSTQTPKTPAAEYAELDDNLNTPVTSKPKVKKTPKRKLDSVENESSSKKPREKSLSDQDSDITSQKSGPPEAPVTSRSGRKIKPKKVEELDDSNSGTYKVKSTKTPKQKDSIEEIDLDADLLKDGIVQAFTPKGEQIRLKLQMKNKPAVFKSEKARLEWEAKLLEEGQKLKMEIESGKLIPENVKKEIDEKYKDRLVQIEQKMAHNDKNEKLEYLKIEAQLLDIDVRIKNTLSLKQADPDACLSLMDELISLKLNPLMLKKHPEVVDTIKKLRKYIGNTSTWNMTDEDVLLFSNKAASIRSKAEHVYNKFKSLFMVPHGKAFWDIFAQELKEFNACTAHLDTNELCGLTTDPTESSSKTSDEVIKAVETVNSSDP